MVAWGDMLNMIKFSEVMSGNVYGNWKIIFKKCRKIYNWKMKIHRLINGLYK